MSSMGCKQQLWTLLLGATTKTLPDRQVLRLRRLRLQNAKNTITSKAITTLNPLKLRQLVCMVSLPPLFWVASQRNLLVCLVTPGSASGSTSACPLVLIWLSVSPLPLVLIYSYRLPNPRSFCKFHCSLSCAVLPCA